MADPSEVFREAVREFINVHDQLLDAGKQLKEVRRKKGELADTILAYMRANAIDECAMGANGKLVRRESKRVEGLKSDHVMNELRAAVGESRAEEHLKAILSKREVTIKESLSRRKTGAKSVIDTS